MDQNVTFRPFAFDDSDYDLLQKLYATLYPDHLRTIDALKTDDTELEEVEHFWRRYVIQVGGQNVGIAFVQDDYLSAMDGEYTLSIEIDPDYFSPQSAKHTLNHLLNDIQDRNPQRLRAETRDTLPDIMQFWESEGFRQAMRHPESTLDLTTFDEGRFEMQVIEMELAKIRIIDWQKLRETIPTWRKTWYDFYAEVITDVPTASGVAVLPFEDFVKHVDGAAMRVQYRWFALSGYTVVGLTGLHPYEAMPQQMGTALTAVGEVYRRKGLATVLKVKSLVWARENGIERIITSNHEDNPMLKLNQRLGFVETSAWLDYVKDIN